MKFITKEKIGTTRIVKIFGFEFKYDRNNFRRSKIAFSAKIKNAKLEGANIIGKNVEIRADKTSSIFIEKGTDIGDGCKILAINNAHIHIGKNCRIGQNNQILAGANIKIGDNALIASSVIIRTGNHNYEDIETPVMYQGGNYKEINIGSNGWIADRVMILAWAEIGNHSVIGAGSIVTKSIPDYSVAAGVPCKIIKKYNFETKTWKRFT